MVLNAEEENIFFVSDTHFNHDNIIKFSNRPFEDVNEMNESIKESWNSVVGKHDHVFMLGDVALGKPKDVTNLLYALNGYIYLIKGNHEKAVLSNENNKRRFEWIKDYYELKEKSTGFKICMFHYPCRQWNKCHRGAWHLFGHVHGKLEHWPWGRSMDVGVDNAVRFYNEYRPFSFEDIKEQMDQREIIRHH